ncbi:RepB family plasmid replication initiator protein, partial [Kingella kingae]|uniref:RepB family plasmid replication initiator protein n=1 Tax=Kingella kingae TaxID=504 RepID=UPI00254EA92E
VIMGKLVVKDNALIEASHRLSEIENRLILLAIVQARAENLSIEQLTGKELTIHADEYVKIFGTDKDTGYWALKKAVMKLFRAEWGYKKVNEKGNVVVAYERFTQSAKYIQNEGIVKFKFADAIVPFLVELEKHFT